MTAPMVDDLTDSGSNKDRECIGPGVADILTGSLGGMAGCAMIGQSAINSSRSGAGVFQGWRPACVDKFLGAVLGAVWSFWRRTSYWNTNSTVSAKKHLLKKSLTIQKTRKQEMLRVFFS